PYHHERPRQEPRAWIARPEAKQTRQTRRRSQPRRPADSGALLSPVPRPNRDERLLRASLVHASPSHLNVLLSDRRAWVRRVAAAEEARRVRERGEEVICREPLRQLVRDFVGRWNRERPPHAGQFIAEGRQRR